MSLIGNARGPVAVPSEDIESLKIMVVANKEVITGYQLQEGDRVMVVGGPFSGMTGIFVRYKGINRVVINISALGQFASVEVNEEDIEILPEKHHKSLTFYQIIFNMIFRQFNVHQIIMGRSNIYEQAGAYRHLEK